MKKVKTSNKPATSFSRKAGSSSSRANDDDDDELAEVPTRSREGGSKKSKSKEVVPLANSDDSDGEDPLPRSIRKKGSGNGTKGSRKHNAISDDDSDDEDPLPKSMRKKGTSKKDTPEKKRKARVLSDSDDDDFDFKPQKKSSKDKPNASPIKREAKKEQEKEKPSSSRTSSRTPEKKKDEKQDKDSSNKSGKGKSTPSKSKPHNGSDGDSPHRQPTSLIEPKKLRMGTVSPEKDQKSKPTSKSHASSGKKSTPVKEEPKFKVPTPITKEKSKSRTNPQKRHIEEDDDEEEEDFNPKKKAATSSSSVGKGKKKPPAKDSDGKDTKREITPQQKENFKNYLAKASMKPQNLGSKEIPIGAPNCLQGLAFVISGVLDSLEREDCQSLIDQYGGRVTSSVSGKTNYLIIGVEAGQSKIKKAVKLKIPQIDEDELLDMIRKSNPAGNSQDSGLPFSEGVAVIDSEEFKTEDEESKFDADKSLFDSPLGARKEDKRSSVKSNLGKLSKQESSKKSPSLEKDAKVKPEGTTTSKSSSVPFPITDNDIAPSEMWVDKYKPKNLKNVVGQGSENSNAKKLLRWLQNWFKYHGTSKDKPKAAWPGLRDPEGKTFKAALLSGPPGIGKTTSAHLVVKDVGYDYFELNASDTRNKRGLRENVADALSSKTLAFGRTDGENARKHVLIMDEVDGMSGNEDRGGVQELIGLIKSSRVPVICICNDRNHQKIRSLANWCFDLRFNKPSFEQLRAFVLSICFKEKIKLPQEKIQQLIISTDNDVRQILHQLQLFKEGKSDQAFNPRKDLRFGPWDVIRKVFLKSEHAKMSIHDKNGLFFQDYNIGPLFVQENYLRWAPAAAGGNQYKYMDIIGKTAASLADGDLADNLIRRKQNWGLLPVQAVFGSYLPGEYMSSDTVGRVEFPAWLGKNSNKNKRHRLLQSLHSHLHLHVSGSLEALNMDYLPYLSRTLTKPLVEGDHESAAKVMEKYTLLRDDIESITDLSTWPGTKNPMEKVDSKVKAAFTRQVNKEILPYSNAKPTKGKGRAAANPEDDLEALLEEGEEVAAVVEEEEEESIEKDAMVKVKTRRKAGSSKASSSKASTATASSSKGRGKKKDDEDIKSSKSKQPTKSRSRK